MSHQNVYYMCRAFLLLASMYSPFTVHFMSHFWDKQNHFYIRSSTQSNNFLILEKLWELVASDIQHKYSSSYLSHLVNYKNKIYITVITCYLRMQCLILCTAQLVNVCGFRIDIQARICIIYALQCNKKSKWY